MECADPDTAALGLRVWRLSLQGVGDAFDDFLLGRKPIPSLRRDNCSRDGNLENPGVPLNQRRFDAELFLQRSRRTGGLGEVASGGAVGDGNHVEAVS